MAFTTPQEYADYYAERIAYWTRKAERFIAPTKKARAKRRVKTYTEKLVKLVSENEGLKPAEGTLPEGFELPQLQEA